MCEAEIIAQGIVELVLAGVRTPERARSPHNSYLTDEDIFNQLNPTVRFFLFFLIFIITSGQSSYL